MKKRLRNRLIRIAIMIVLIIALAEFQKYMKNRCGTCSDGVCKAPSGHGLIINPFPPETTPAKTSKPSLPRLIDFGAGKCVTCKMMNTVLEELSSEYTNRMDVHFVDVWKNEEAGKEHSIRMIPTQVFLDAEGNELFRHEGFISKEDILKKWAELGINFISNE